MFGLLKSLITKRPQNCTSAAFVLCLWNGNETASLFRPVLVLCQSWWRELMRTVAVWPWRKHYTSGEFVSWTRCLMHRPSAIWFTSTDKTEAQLPRSHPKAAWSTLHNRMQIQLSPPGKAWSYSGQGNKVPSGKKPRWDPRLWKAAIFFDSLLKEERKGRSIFIVWLPTSKAKLGLGWCITCPLGSEVPGMCVGAAGF